MLHAHEGRRFHARLMAENLGKLAHVGWRIAGPIRRGAHKEYVRSLCDELQVFGGRVAATSKLLGELIAGEHVHDLKVRCCGLPLPDEPFEPVLGVTTLRAVDAEHTCLLPRRLRWRGHCATPGSQPRFPKLLSQVPSKVSTLRFPTAARTHLDTADLPPPPHTNDSATGRHDQVA